MESESRALTPLSHARRLLADARTVDEVKDIRDKAQLAKAYARKKGLAHEIVVDASAIKVEAERKLGELLRNTTLANSSPGNQHTGKLNRSRNGTGPIHLRDLGITKSDSSRAQRIARIPQSTFNRYVRHEVAAGREPTTAGLLRLAKQHEVAESVNGKPPASAGFVRTLAELVRQGRSYSTIYVDPPWPYANQGTRAATDNHYPTLTLDQIRAEPVASLAAEKAHLHLWTTTSFLAEALSVIEAWGFTYKSMFVWVKPTLGIGNYYRVAHEMLLLGVKGSLPFQDKAQRSWLELPRSGHSTKPEAVRQLIERVSPGPFLEMYGRRRPTSPAWTIYGNQFLNEDQT